MTHPFSKRKSVEMTAILGLSGLKLSSVLGAHMNNEGLKGWRNSGRPHSHMLRVHKALQVWS